MSPQRVQRKRIKGQPGMPVGARYVGRPSACGNPFRIGVPFCGPTIQVLHTAREIVAKFDAWVQLEILDPRCWDRELVDAHSRLKAVLASGVLAGCDLACWCPLDQPCHADVLIRIANQEGS